MKRKPSKPQQKNLIREARLKAGLTQDQAARKVGWPQPTWARFERHSERATVRTFRTAARALGCSITDLLE